MLSRAAPTLLTAAVGVVRYCGVDGWVQTSDADVRRRSRRMTAAVAAATIDPTRAGGATTVALQLVRSTLYVAVRSRHRYT